MIKHALAAIALCLCATTAPVLAGNLPPEPTDAQWTSANADARFAYGVAVARATCPEVRATPGRPMSVVRVAIMLPFVSPAMVRKGAVERCNVARAEAKTTFAANGAARKVRVSAGIILNNR